MEAEKIFELKEKLKKKLRSNSMSLKTFWRVKSGLMQKNVSYQYFLNQINLGATMQPEVREAIEKFIDG